MLKKTLEAAFAMQEFLSEYGAQRRSQEKIPFEMRIGLHSGSVVAGIVGIRKFAYDIWGDTVNIASRMESAGSIGRVNISQETYEHIKHIPKFNCVPRGKVEIKGHWDIEMYFVEKQFSTS